jgi:hypothetical protein
MYTKRVLGWLIWYTICAASQKASVQIPGLAKKQKQKNKKHPQKPQKTKTDPFASQ